MVDKTMLERNYQLIYDRLSGQIDVSLEKGNKFIDKEMSGLFFIGIKPIVKMFYNQIKRKDMASGTEKQIDITLEAAKEAVLNPDKQLDEILQKHFSNYLKYDQTNLGLKKSHPNYKLCVENLKNTFRAQVQPLVKLMKCEEPDVNSYLELTAKTFKTKENCMENMEAQMTYMNKGIEILSKDINILNLPVGKDILFKVLKAGYEETWNEVKEEVKTNPYFKE